MPLEFALDLRQGRGICAALHQKIEVLAEHFFPGVSGQGEKGVIGEDDRMAGFFRVRENHCHPCFLGGDDERATFVPKAFDIGFGSLLPFGLVDYLFRHTWNVIRISGQSYIGIIGPTEADTLARADRQHKSCGGDGNVVADPARMSAK